MRMLFPRYPDCEHLGLHILCAKFMDLLVDAAHLLQYVHPNKSVRTYVEISQGKHNKTIRLW